jgi:hypothetical protein
VNREIEMASHLRKGEELKMAVKERLHRVLRLVLPHKYPPDSPDCEYCGAYGPIEDADPCLPAMRLRVLATLARRRADRIERSR